MYSGYEIHVRQVDPDSGWYMVIKHSRNPNEPILPSETYVSHWAAMRQAKKLSKAFRIPVVDNRSGKTRNYG